METLYTSSVTAIGGRDGQIKSSDGVLDMELRKPKEMGGPGSFTNPEQLFAAAWGACYLSALKGVAKHDKVDATDAHVNVQISFNKDGQLFELSAVLDVHIPNISLAVTQELAEKAHKVCPYSKAIRNNIKVEITAV